MKLLRQRAVTEQTGLPRAAIYLLMRQNEFPQSVKLYGRAVAWREDQVQEWIESRPPVEPNSS